MEYLEAEFGVIVLVKMIHSLINEKAGHFKFSWADFMKS